MPKDEEVERLEEDQGEGKKRSNVQMRLAFLVLPVLGKAGMGRGMGMIVDK